MDLCGFNGFPYNTVPYNSCLFGLQRTLEAYLTSEPGLVHGVYIPKDESKKLQDIAPWFYVTKALDNLLQASIDIRFDVYMGPLYEEIRMDPVRAMKPIIDFTEDCRAVMERTFGIEDNNDAYLDFDANISNVIGYGLSAYLRAVDDITFLYSANKDEYAKVADEITNLVSLLKQRTLEVSPAFSHFASKPFEENWQLDDAIRFLGQPIYFMFVELYANDDLVMDINKYRTEDMTVWNTLNLLTVLQTKHEYVALNADIVKDVYQQLYLDAQISNERFFDIVKEPIQENVLNIWGEYRTNTGKNVDEYLKLWADFSVTTFLPVVEALKKEVNIAEFTVEANKFIDLVLNAEETAFLGLQLERTLSAWDTLLNHPMIPKSEAFQSDDELLGFLVGAVKHEYIKYAEDRVSDVYVPKFEDMGMDGLIYFTVFAIYERMLATQIDRFLYPKIPKTEDLQLDDTLLGFFVDKVTHEYVEIENVRSFFIDFLGLEIEDLKAWDQYRMLFDKDALQEYLEVLDASISLIDVLNLSMELKIDPELLGFYVEQLKFAQMQMKAAKVFDYSQLLSTELLLDVYGRLIGVADLYASLKVWDDDVQRLPNKVPIIDLILDPQYTRVVDFERVYEAYPEFLDILYNFFDKEKMEDDFKLWELEDDGGGNRQTPLFDIKANPIAELLVDDTISEFFVEFIIEGALELLDKGALNLPLVRTLLREYFDMELEEDEHRFYFRMAGESDYLLSIERDSISKEYEKV